MKVLSLLIVLLFPCCLLSQHFVWVNEDSFDVGTRKYHLVKTATSGYVESPVVYMESIKPESREEYNGYFSLSFQLDSVTHAGATEPDSIIVKPVFYLGSVGWVEGDTLQWTSTVDESTTKKQLVDVTDHNTIWMYQSDPGIRGKLEAQVVRKLKWRVYWLGDNTDCKFRMDLSGL